MRLCSSWRPRPTAAKKPYAPDVAKVDTPTRPGGGQARVQLDWLPTAMLCACCQQNWDHLKLSPAG